MTALTQMHAHVRRRHHRAAGTRHIIGCDWAQPESGSTLAARDVPAGTVWAFTEHRSLAEADAVAEGPVDA